MKRAAAALLIGSALLMVQGSVNTFFPAHALPDLRFLIVVGVGLHWRSAAGGVAIVALLGFTADLLSGSLLGEQALLSMFAFAVARFTSLQLNLRGALPQAFFVFGLSVANALGIGMLDAFFGVREGIGAAMLQYLPLHALVNAIAAPFVARGVEVLASAFGAEEAGRRQVHLPTARRPVG